MNSSSPPSASRVVPAAASALLERHGASLRRYLGQLPGAEAARVERVLQELVREIGVRGELDDDPAVWLFTRARQQLVGTGSRGDVLRAEAAEAPEGDEAAENQDSRIAVHRAFARLTSKQQEALRLKYQFGFNPEEVARITSLSTAGAAGLLQHAISRIVQALPAGPGRPGAGPGDPRVIAYALDEMEAGEKKLFVESQPDGKALLETTEIIRRAARELTGILQNGAPPPRRRRARRGGWIAWRWVAAGTALLLAAGAVWWRMENHEAHEASAAPTGAERDRRRPSGKDRAILEEPATPSEAVATGRPARRRELRPGEAEWERKSFGRGNGQGAGLTGNGGGGGVSTSPGGFGALGGSGGSGSAGGVLTDGAEPEATRLAADDPPAVVLPAASAGGGAVLGGLAAVTPAGGPGAMRGPTMTDLQSIPAGPTAKGQPTPDAGGPAGLLRPGLKDLQRALARRQWPGPDQVVPGALLRQIPPEWPEPGRQPQPVAVRMELAPSPFSPGRHVLRVVVQARAAPPPARPPANLVLAIDVSDSMNAPNRLPLVQEGVRLLAERLRPEDRVAVVTYAAEAREVRASEPIGENGRALRDSLQALSAEGRTNGYEGLALAYAVARRARSETGPNAVILCTDGNFNLGETDERTLAGLAARFAADGIRLSVFGFGRSDRNDLRLELLAWEGGGSSCYVNTREETERLLAGQVDGLLEPVARDVVWRVAFDPTLAAAAQTLGGEEGEPVGELLPGRSLTALYELDLSAGARTPGGLGEVQVDYRGAAEPGRVRRNMEVAATDWERTGPGFRFAVAMAELGRILRGPPGEAAPALARLETWTDANLPDDAGGYRQDLRETIKLARNAAGL